MRFTPTIVVASSLLAWTTVASPAATPSTSATSSPTASASPLVHLCDASAQWTSSSGIVRTFDCSSTKYTCAGPVAQARTESGCSKGTDLTYFSTSGCGKEADGGQFKANAFALALQKQGFLCIPQANPSLSSSSTGTISKTTSALSTPTYLCSANGYYSTQSLAGINDYFVFCKSLNTKCADAVPQARAASGCTAQQDSDVYSISKCGYEDQGGSDRRNVFALSLEKMGFTCDPPAKASPSTTSMTTTMRMTTSTTRKTTTTSTKTTSKVATTSKAGLLEDPLGFLSETVEDATDDIVL